MNSWVLFNWLLLFGILIRLIHIAGSSGSFSLLYSIYSSVWEEPQLCSLYVVLLVIIGLFTVWMVSSRPVMNLFINLFSVPLAHLCTHFAQINT